MKNYIYIDQLTGEVVDSLRDVIRTFICNFRDYRIISWHWKRVRS